MTTAGRKQHNITKANAIWYLIVACLIAGVLMWWWFELRIERIDHQIEMYGQQ